MTYEYKTCLVCEIVERSTNANHFICCDCMDEESDLADKFAEMKKRISELEAANIRAGQALVACNELSEYLETFGELAFSNIPAWALVRNMRAALEAYRAEQSGEVANG